MPGDAAAYKTGCPPRASRLVRTLAQKWRGYMSGSQKEPGRKIKQDKRAENDRIGYWNLDQGIWKGLFEEVSPEQRPRAVRGRSTVNREEQQVQRPCDVWRTNLRVVCMELSSGRSEVRKIREGRGGPGYGGAPGPVRGLCISWKGKRQALLERSE